MYAVHDPRRSFEGRRRPLRLRARAGGKSLNEAVVDALVKGAGIAGKHRKRRDLTDIAGRWKTDKGVESALGDLDLVVEDL